MDVYRQASEVVRAVREGSGTAKGLCLSKEMQKKKQTYAVVCETLRHYDLLQDVLEQAEFFKYYPHANKGYAICMAYDVVLGKGLNTSRDFTARAIQQSVHYLREAYEQVKKHHIIPPRLNGPGVGEGGDAVSFNASNYSQSGCPQDESGDGSRTLKSSQFQVPRYARVNTLKIDVETLVDRFRRASLKRSSCCSEENETGGQCQKNDKQQKTRNYRRLPEFTRDPIVPSLLVFPAGTDLHAHPAVRSGQLILQDRASCLPACVLLDAVEVCKSSLLKKVAALEYVLDACAAPGNKTTQLAALGAPNIKIMAIERDEKRAELLYNRVQSLGAGDYVNVLHMDFFQMSSADREATEGILLDPSCSASGVWTRVDVALQQKQRECRISHAGTESDNNNNRSGGGSAGGGGGGGEGCNCYGDGGADVDGTRAACIESEDDHCVDFAKNTDRIMGLARVQRKLLMHALLSFSNCRTVVYSTCSVHEEENECVVRQVLEDARVQARGWTLSNIMPTVWKTRGRKTAADVFPLDYTIRCDFFLDATNSFFVARFDRSV